MYVTWVLPAMFILFGFDYRIERYNRRVFLQQQMVAFRFRKHHRAMQDTNSLVEKTALPEVRNPCNKFIDITCLWFSNTMLIFVTATTKLYREHLKHYDELEH